MASGAVGVVGVGGPDGEELLPGMAAVVAVEKAAGDGGGTAVADDGGVGLGDEIGAPRRVSGVAEVVGHDEQAPGRFGGVEERRAAGLATGATGGLEHEGGQDGGEHGASSSGEGVDDAVQGWGDGSHRVDEGGVGSGSGISSATPWATMGYSQGGGASGCAASLAPSYALEINLITDVSGGVPAAVGWRSDRFADLPAPTGCVG
jgi:secretory lipase